MIVVNNIEDALRTAESRYEASIDPRNKANRQSHIQSFLRSLDDLQASVAYEGFKYPTDVTRYFMLWGQIEGCKQVAVETTKRGWKLNGGHYLKFVKSGLSEFRLAYYTAQTPLVQQPEPNKPRATMESILDRINGPKQSIPASPPKQASDKES